MVWVITNCKRQVLWTTHWVWTLNVVPLVNTGKELSMKGRLTVLQMFLPFSEFFLKLFFSDLYIYIYVYWVDYVPHAVHIWLIWPIISGVSREFATAMSSQVSDL
jgi:hypothetical protein